jgi:Tfp pilus assembly protein PilF
LRTRGIVSVVGIFVVALAVRLVAVRSGLAEPFFFGKYLVLGDALRESGFIADRPFSYAPIYTYFVALGKLVFGQTLYPILLVQATIGSFSCVLILRIARRLVGPGWALVPALIACFYRSFVLYDVTFLSDSLGLAFQLALLLLLLRTEPGARWQAHIPIGVLIGLSVLHRPNNLLLLPLIVAVMWLRESPRTTGLRRGALVAAVAIVVTLPVVAQNYRLSGTAGVTASNPGYIFYSSNNASSYGFRYSPPELFYRGSAFYEKRRFEPGQHGRQFLGDAEIATVISGAIEGRAMSLRESSRYYLGVTLRHMRHYPGHYAALWFHRAWLAFNGLESHDVLPVFVRYASVSRLTPLSFAWIAPLGLLGLFFSLRNYRQYVWLYVLVLNNLLLLWVFYVVVRFRLPIEAVLVIMTGLALRTICRWLRAREIRRLLLCGVALVLLALACNWSFPSTAERAHSRELEVMLEDARRLYGKGDLDGAAQRLERLIRVDGEDLPRSLQAHQLLAKIYSRPDASFENSAMRSPDHFERPALIRRLEEKLHAGRITFEERRYLGHLYGQAERPAEARTTLSETLALRPAEPLTRYELARTEWALGETTSARDHLLTAIDDGLLFTSRGLQGAYLLARIYRDQGETERAEFWTGQAARVSSMTPWIRTDEFLDRLIAELRTQPGYIEPLPLESLIPLKPR